MTGYACEQQWLGKFPPSHAMTPPDSPLVSSPSSPSSSPSSSSSFSSYNTPLDYSSSKLQEEGKEGRRSPARSHLNKIIRCGHTGPGRGRGGSQEDRRQGQTPRQRDGKWCRWCPLPRGVRRQKGGGVRSTTRTEHHPYTRIGKSSHHINPKGGKWSPDSHRARPAHPHSPPSTSTHASQINGRARGWASAPHSGKSSTPMCWPPKVMRFLTGGELQRST